MADIRSLSLAGPALEATPSGAPQAGFTANARYPVVGLAYDNATFPPPVYVIVLDDASTLRTLAASFFSYRRVDSKPA